LFGQNVELLNVKPGGTYSNHWVVELYLIVVLSVIECRVAQKEKFCSLYLKVQFALRLKLCQDYRC